MDITTKMTDLHTQEFWAILRAAGVRGGTVRNLFSESRDPEFWTEDQDTGAYVPVCQAPTLRELAEQVIALWTDSPKTFS